MSSSTIIIFCLDTIKTPYCSGYYLLNILFLEIYDRNTGIALAKFYKMEGRDIFYPAQIVMDALPVAHDLSRERHGHLNMCQICIIQILIQFRDGFIDGTADD